MTLICSILLLLPTVTGVPQHTGHVCKTLTNLLSPCRNGRYHVTNVTKLVLRTINWIFLPLSFSRTSTFFFTYFFFPFLYLLRSNFYLFFPSSLCSFVLYFVCFLWELFNLFLDQVIVSVSAPKLSNSTDENNIKFDVTGSQFIKRLQSADAKICK